METFQERLRRLINSMSMESHSNTPDFILAQYLLTCLAAFDVATNAANAICALKAATDMPS